MTFDEYTLAVEQATIDHPSWRIGQAAFNVLWENRSDLSEQVRGTALDPYYNSNTVPEFYAWVKREWNTRPSATASALSTTTE